MKKIIFPVLLFLLLASPCFVFASVSVSEIMYDPKGSNSGRQWVELYNGGSGSVDLSGFNFYEGSVNHRAFGYSGGLCQGDAAIAPGGYVIITNDSCSLAKFHLDYPGYSGTVFHSALSFTGEPLVLKNGDAMEDTPPGYDSSMGAKDDGNSLQKIAGVWKSGIPTPGAENAESAPADSGSGDDSGGASSDSQVVISSGSSSSSSGSSSSFLSVSNQSSAPKSIKTKIEVADKIILFGIKNYFTAKVTDSAGREVADGKTVWNFGNGEIKEGGKILYSYQFPGDYVVFAESSWKDFKSSDSVKIKVVAPALKISKIQSGPGGFIEIQNSSPYQTDVSFWRIISGGKYFSIPKNTFVVPQGKITLPASIAGISFGSDAEILTPEGKDCCGVRAQGIAQAEIPSENISAGSSAGLSSEYPRNYAVLTDQVVSSSQKTGAESGNIWAVAETSQSENVASATETANVTLSDSSENSRGNSSGFSGAGIYSWVVALVGLIALGIFASFVVGKKSPTPDEKAGENSAAEIAADIKIIE